MKKYEMRQEEKEFLDNYDIANFERPSIATDITVFSILGDGESDNFRKLPEKSLKILMIKRATFPYKNCWSLPGGFCRPDEDVHETAKRELYEETNVKNAFLQPVGIFGDKGRDPRGWIISNTFLALIDGEKYELRAGTDAWEAKWFTVELEEKVIKEEYKEKAAHIVTEHKLKLIHSESGIVLTALIREDKQYKNYHETVKYKIVQSDGIGFDHGKIIVHSLLSLRKKVEQEQSIVFDLMPEEFRLTELQNAFELILDKKLLTANFRRKIGDYVIETDSIAEGAGHRPAKLFVRNVEAFYR